MNWVEEIRKIKEENQSLRARIKFLDLPDRPARFVGKVVDNGALPTEPNRVHLVRPEKAAWPSTEGASTNWTDGSGFVAVGVLGDALTAGTRVEAWLVEGYWLAESVPAAEEPPSECPPGEETRVCVEVREPKVEGASIPLPGVDVDITKSPSGTPVGSGQTDQTGYYCVLVDSTGMYMINACYDWGHSSGPCCGMKAVTVAELCTEAFAQIMLCCSEICVNVIDYDTGLPISGVTVTGPGGSGVTDSNGDVCFNVTGFLTGAQYIGSHPDYWESGTGSCVSVPCFATTNYTLALYPKSKYVRLSPQCGLCPEDNRCDNPTARNPYFIPKTLYVKFNGPSQIFGSLNNTNIQLDWDPTTSDDMTVGSIRWKSTCLNSGAPLECIKGANVTTVNYRSTNVTLTYFESSDLCRAILHFQNYLSVDCGVTPYDPADFNCESTPFTPALLTGVRYCVQNGTGTVLARYPAGVKLQWMPDPDSTCDVLWPVLNSQCGQQGFSDDSAQGFSKLCGPVDRINYLFWCGCSDFADSDCLGDPRPTATYSLFE